MYRFRQDKNYLDLLDGRRVNYIAHNIPLNREYTSLILRGLMGCSLAVASRIVSICKYSGNVLDYFERIESEG